MEPAIYCLACVHGSDEKIVKTIPIHVTDALKYSSTGITSVWDRKSHPSVTQLTQMNGGWKCRIAKNHVSLTGTRFDIEVIPLRISGCPDHQIVEAISIDISRTTYIGNFETELRRRAENLDPCTA